LKLPLLPKIIVVDTNFLIANADPKTSEDTRHKIENIFKVAEKIKTRIILPMPAIAEYLVQADEGALNILNTLERKTFIFAAPFDRFAAFECALLERQARESGDKRDGSTIPWQKIKIDRQIIGIARAQGATLIITNDQSLKLNALRFGISSIDIDEFELPEDAKQRTLPSISKK
jgi:predicted nucleic acid-binding protein